MPVYNLRVYDFDPLGLIPAGAGGTFTWSGPAVALGTATITDNETGIEGQTLDSNVAGGETATADVTIGGATSTGAPVYAEEVWQVQDQVTNEIFEITTLRVNAGGATGWYTISEIPLVAGRTYEVLQSNFDPDVLNGDIAFGLDEYVAPDSTITGTAGNDNIDASYTGDPELDRVDDGFGVGVDGNDDNIEALAGDDTVASGLGNDTVDGGDGNDSIDGGVGNDSLLGGANNDTIDGGADNDTIDGGDGNDSIDGGAGADSILGGANNDTIDGGDNNDTIDGGAGTDIIDGGAGDDSIIGGTGNDSLSGGADNDTLDGGWGSDTLRGGDGNDELDGSSTGAAADLLFGEAGNDTLYSSTGTTIDTLNGGTGDDLLIDAGGTGGDFFFGNSGNDTILGADGADSIAGGGGDDNIEGGDGNDTIDGSVTGLDPASTTEVLDWSLAGGDGTNVAGGVTQTTGGVEINVTFTDSGNNNPTFLIETSDPNFVDTGEDFDPNSALRLFGDGDAETSRTRIDFSAIEGEGMTDEVENVSFRINDIDSFTGNHIDTITVNAFDADGNSVPVVITPEGDDTVDAAGNTITAGAALDDPIDANGSALVEIAGPVAYFEIIYVNGLNVTHAVLVSDVYFDTIPESDNDVIDAGLGDDLVDGGIGDDTITGGEGADTLSGGAGNDVFVLEDGFDNDIITDFDIGDDDGNGFFNDQLDVSNLTDEFGNPVNAWDVTVSGDGFGNALLTFPNGETMVLQGVAPAAVTGAQLLNAAGVPCFTEGTFITTARGEVPVQNLIVGDRVATLDNGWQEIRWIGKRNLGPRELLAQPELKPICIPQGVLGNYAPLFVSPQHAMLLDHDDAAQGLFARAKHLAEAVGPVRVANGKKKVTYIHLMFDAHQVVFANGAATESFYPGKFALDMFPDQIIEEIVSVVPALRDQTAEVAYGPTARPVMKRKDVMKLGKLRQIVPTKATHLTRVA